MTQTVFDLAESRRAIKDFDNIHTMPDADLNQILTAARFTPTAFNVQNYRFVVVQDKETRHAENFLAACWNQVKVAECSALIILCAHKDAWKTPKKYWQSVGPETQDMMAGMIDSYYNGKDRVQLDECHRSCGMAGMTIMLAAQALGYETCPMDGFDYEAVGKLINLPDDHIISFMIAVGKKAKEPFPRPTLLSTDETVIRERF